MMSKKISRRTFIKAALTTGIALGGGLVLGCGGNENTMPSGKLPVKFLRQIITKDSTTSRCIMWQSDSPMTEPIIEITIGDEVKKIPAQNSTFTDDDTENFQYTAQIDGLKPNSTYEFKIVDGAKSTENFELKTYDENKFKGIIFSDSQSANYEVWGGVAKSAFEKNPDAEFFINMGDLVDNGEDRTQWEAWMTQVEEPLTKLPFVPIMGNHECYARDWKERYPMAYLNYFAVPENDNKYFNRRYYSFDFGAAHFVVLDSQWDELETFAPGIIEAQINWLRKDLENTKKAWKIVCIHRDVLQYKIIDRDDWNEGFSSVGTTFMPEFDFWNVDVVFTAHLHTYRNRGHIRDFNEDPTGPLYILTGLSGDVRYPGLWANHTLDKFVAPQPETDNFLTIEGDDKNLIIKCFLPDGTKLDEVKLTKKENQEEISE
ncbi:MAG: metallophosphoesterase family protein [Selenomonadaceae bacterium]|nr:metallophosphoesterase family protein [Selenomonadaceae bacterium]